MYHYIYLSPPISWILAINWRDHRNAPVNAAQKRDQLIKKTGIVFPLFDSSHCIFSISVSRLTNWGKSKRTNPRIIYSWAPVNPLMTFLMKVTSLQNGDCSFFFFFLFCGCTAHSADGLRRQTQHISEQQSAATRLLARRRHAPRLMRALDK